MRFLKQHFDEIVKLYVNQIGVAIIAMFLYTAAGALGNESGISLFIKVMISVVAISFYFSLLYVWVWEIGAKDKIRIDAGKAEREPSKGIKLGLFANAPNYIVIGAALILFSIYMLGGSDGFKSAFAILNMIFRIFVSMYLGAMQGIFSALSQNEDLYYLCQTAGFLVCALIAAIVTHVSYTMGLNDKRLFKKFKK